MVAPRPQPRRVQSHPLRPPRIAAAAAPASGGHHVSVALIVLVALGLGLAVLAMAAAATPEWVLPPDAALVLDENRKALALGGIACAAGVGIGLLIALAGS